MMDGPKPKPLLERFWSKVDVRGKDDCWNWIGATGGHGYGELRINKPRTMILVHRLSFEIHKGPIPDGFFVCHRCDNKICCNPDHLFAGSPKDNMDDMWRKGRGVKSQLGKHINYGSTHGAAKLTEDQVREIRAKAKDYSYSQLAKMYGVTVGNIGFIVRRKGWKHVE